MDLLLPLVLVSVFTSVGKFLFYLLIMAHVTTFLGFFSEVLIGSSQEFFSRLFGEYLNLIVKVIKKTLGTGRYIHVNTAFSCC